MKISNKIFVAALTLLLVALTAYNIALRAEYRTGKYRDPLANYNRLTTKGFDQIDVPAASSLSVRIAAGPAAVWVRKDVKDVVRVTQTGGRLTVAAAYPGTRQWFGPGPAVVIYCPRLRQLRTDAIYSKAGKTHTDKEDNMGQVVVRNFQQDSLLISQNYGTDVHLEGNRLNYLSARAGQAPGSRAELRIKANNRIGAADLTVRHRGVLKLATAIPGLRTHFSDSATVTFSGAAAGGVGR